jgi:hypothetical protein
MMAYEIKPRASTTTTTFTTSDRVERAARKRTSRLSEFEAEDLRYLWAGFSVDMGMRSPHGALESRLLRAPPRDLSAPILDELARLEPICGGWVSEGSLLRMVTSDTRDQPSRGVPSELRLALKRLVREEKVERRAAPMPDVPPRTKLNPKTGEMDPCRTNGEQLQIEDWTGFEVRRAQRTSLALALTPLTPEERWRRADESIEAEWRMLHGTETQHAPAGYDPPENVQMSRVNRARRALAKVSAREARVLEAVYGQHHVGENDEVDAVRALVGGDDDLARKAIEDACSAYRAARGA